jgi:peptidoglycan/LPS O-acetylase OafA/YrhL
MFLLALPLGLNSHTARVSVAYFPWQLTLTDFLWPGLPAVSQPVKAAWTLSCEFLFYFSTPLLFWFLTRRKNPLLASSLLLAGYTIALLLVTALWPDLNWKAYIEVPQFLLGVAGYQLVRRVNLSRWAGALMTSGGLLLAAAAFLQDSLTHCATVPSCTTRIMLSYCAYAPGALLLILGCANISGRIGRFLSLPFLVLLGHASYALYLFHDPALRYLKVVLNREGIVFSPAAGVGVALLVFCLLTGASIACFKLYENPARLNLRSLLKRPLSKAPAV